MMMAVYTLGVWDLRIIPNLLIRIKLILLQWFLQNLLTLLLTILGLMMKTVISGILSCTPLMEVVIPFGKVPVLFGNVRNAVAQ